MLFGLEVIQEATFVALSLFLGYLHAKGQTLLLAGTEYVHPCSKLFVNKLTAK